MREVSVDDAVHYYAEGKPFSGPYDAVVTAVGEKQRVDLIVQFPTGVRIKQGVPFSTSPLKHHWCYPPAR